MLPRFFDIQRQTKVARLFRCKIMNNDFFIDDFKCAHWIMDIGKVNAFGKAEIQTLENLLTKCESLYPNTIRMLSIESHKISPGGYPVFCAGANQKERQHWSFDEKSKHLKYQRSVVHKFRKVPYWVICCVDGLALGLGVEFCIAADFVLASPKADFCFPEKNLGIIPGAGGYSWAHHYAKDLLYAQHLIDSCEHFDRDHAKYLGIVDICCESDDFEANLINLSKQLSLLEPEVQQRKKRDYYSNIDFSAFFEEEQRVYENLIAD